MQLTNDKEIIIKKIIQNITKDVQDNLFLILDMTIEDDIQINTLDHDITFTLLKNYRIEHSIIKQWLEYIQI